MTNKQQQNRRSSIRLDWKSLLILILIGIFTVLKPAPEEHTVTPDPSIAAIDVIPAYAGAPYVELNGNMPEFDITDSAPAPFEEYGALDELGRCTQAISCVGLELMPTEERGNISAVKPTGWHRSEYDFIDGGLLYNRCHLIAHQFTGENANERNLITGTRYMNEDGMNPFEILIGDYVRQTGNRVLYRVTPVFEEDELIARGVQMEALSIEDNGEGICFNIFCYNVQPGIEIDYSTGDNWLSETTCDHEAVDYVLNTNSMKYHLATCDGIDDISQQNIATFTGCYETLDARGYTPCGSCRPGG